MDQTHPSTGLGHPHPGAELEEGTFSDQAQARTRRGGPVSLGALDSAAHILKLRGGQTQRP